MYAGDLVDSEVVGAVAAEEVAQARVVRLVVVARQQRGHAGAARRVLGQPRAVAVPRAVRRVVCGPMRIRILILCSIVVNDLLNNSIKTFNELSNKIKHTSEKQNGSLGEPHQEYTTYVVY